MPTHDYECKQCNKIEEKFIFIRDLDLPQLCKHGHKQDRLFPKIGATRRDEAPWLRTTTEFLKDGDEETIYKNPVQSRTEYNKLLKEKGLVPVG